MKLLEHFKELSLHPNNTDHLKGFILELALRGTLTKGFNLNRIPAKNRVEGFYEVPSDWYWDKFDDLCEFNMGKTPPSKSHEYWGGEHPWISIADMSTYATVSNTKKTLSDKGLNDYFKDGLVKAGTLIMSFKLTIGKTSILGVDACHNEAIISIYPNERILKDYLFLFLPIISNWGTQVNALMGNTLNKGKIQNLKVPVPPIEEQKAIVEVVNTLFAEVEQLESLTKERIQLKQSFVVSALDKLTEAENTQQEWNFLQQHFSSFFTEKKNIKSLRETILQLAVQGKLTESWRANNPNTEPAQELLKRIEAEKQQLIAEKKIKKEKPLPPIREDEMPYELPEGWVWCRFAEIVINRDGERRPITKSDRVAGKYDYYGASGVIDKVEDYLFEDNLLLIGEDGANLINRSTPIAFFARGKYWVNNHAHVLDSPFMEVLEYLEVYINGISLVDYITGMAQPKMPQKRMNIIPVPLPPLEEQKAIVEKVSSLMTLCDGLEQQIETSQTQIELLMQSCLKEVFEHESN